MLKVSTGLGITPGPFVIKPCKFFNYIYILESLRFLNFKTTTLYSSEIANTKFINVKWRSIKIVLSIELCVWSIYHRERSGSYHIDQKNKEIENKPYITNNTENNSLLLNLTLWFCSEDCQTSGQELPLQKPWFYDDRF